MNPEVVWYIVGAAVSGIVWFVRLEAKVKYLEADHESHKNKTDLLTQQLNTIATSLAKIEGFLYAETKKGDS